jgi:hypothetical protein
VEDFVSEDLLENRAGVGIVVDEFPIDREPSGGGLFRDVQERQQPMIGLAVDGEIVEAVSAGQRGAVEEAPWFRPARTQQRGAALAEHHAVAQFVDRVLEIQTAQERIGREFGGADDVASAVGFDISEHQQLANATVHVAPHPLMDGAHQLINRRAAFRGHNGSHYHIDMRRPSVETAIAIVGAACVVCALAANQAWLDRHFLPSFFIPRTWYVAIETLGRVVVGTIGILTILARRRIAAVDPVRVLSVAMAAALAVGASELVLRAVRLRPTEWLLPQEEPVRRLDAMLGWTLEPSRTGHASVGGRSVDYAIDSSGDRVRDASMPVDPARPTIVFAGESVMFGEGLQWEETIPAQAELLLGIQSANIAVHGYSTDQAYLRLRNELPRFQKPVAVIALFMTALFGRNLDRDRPHLESGLSWTPPALASRLKSLATLVVPFRRDRSVERGIQLTRETLSAIADLARARGATPLIIVPQFGRESPLDESIRRRVFDGAGLPVMRVEIDAGWRLPWDRHPNAAAAKTIATAIAAGLRAQGLGLKAISP